MNNIKYFKNTHWFTGDQKRGYSEKLQVISRGLHEIKDSVHNIDRHK